MNSGIIILIAIGLALDAFAVAIASGVTIRPITIRFAVKVAGLFGGFQAGMPVIGWSAGVGLSYLISGVDHWIAFGLLTIIGCRMIYESREVKLRKMGSLNTHTLLVLSVATSIDALGIGISFPFVEVSLLIGVVIIGSITFGLSLLGVYLGSRIGHLFENFVEIAGGLVLICIGTRILLAHLFG